jgi:hypothetical protein
MRSVVTVVLLVAICTWIGLMVFNFRGYGDRLVKLATEEAVRRQKVGVNLTGATDQQAARNARVSVKIVVPVMFAAMLALTVFFVISLFTD